jgi:hypothetical protein
MSGPAQNVSRAAAASNYRLMSRKLAVIVPAR